MSPNAGPLNELPAKIEHVKWVHGQDSVKKSSEGGKTILPQRFQEDTVVASGMSSKFFGEGVFGRTAKRVAS